MKITDIYEKYKIMPNLQEHQLRVAGVASIICDNFKGEINKNDIITACLLHDMGNIIKFKLELFPEFLEPKGLNYWQKIKDEYIKKYGADEHNATSEIVRELAVNKHIQKIIDSYGFSKGNKTAKSDDFDLKISAYSDHRVTPFGTTSLKERTKDGRKRYVENKNAKFDADFFDGMVKNWKHVEKQIFENASISPDFITDEKVNKEIEKLKEFQI